MPGELVSPADYRVTIVTADRSESFSLVEVPDAKSRLVDVQRGQILINLKLDDLMADLSRSGQLLFLAYCGVAGFAPLRKAITEMQDKLMVLCSDCELTLNAFSMTSEQILDNLTRVFANLIAGEEEWALEDLAACGEVALDMANRATALSNRFTALADDAMKTLGETQIQHGLSEDKRQAIKKQMDDLQVDLARAKVLQDSLASLKAELEQLYAEAKERSDKEDDRAFTLALTSAILSPIAQGVGAFAAVYAKSQNPMSAIPPPAPSPEPTPGGQTITPEQDARVQQLKQDEQDRQEKAEKEEKERQAVEQGTIEEKEKTAKTAEETRALAELKAKEERRIEEAKQAEALKREAATKAISEATREAAAKLADLGKERAEKAESYRQQAKEYLKEKLRVQEEERKNLMDLAGYAVRMTQAADAKGIEENIILSLSQAIGALRRVGVILRNNAQFWTQMADACKRIGGSQTESLQKSIKRFKDRPDRVKYYVEDRFKAQVVSYFASWRALQTVSREYSRNSAGVRVQIQNDFKMNPGTEESRKLAVSLGAKLLATVEAQQQQNDALTKEIQAALTA